MIEKIIYSEDYLDTGEPGVRELHLKPGGEIIKTAYALPQETLKFIKSLTPESDKSYLLINALGASGILYDGGVWGQNRNGDYFAETDLISRQTPQEAARNPGKARGVQLLHYKTFENGHFYRNHTNKDPSTAIGKILFADYDMDMHRVLLVVEFVRSLDPILAGRVDKDLPVSTSMGCKVPGDYCTICGNYSRKPDRSDACVHVKSMLGQIMPDGRRVGMINKEPRFFDISKVYIGADATSRVLSKVASSNWLSLATHTYTMPRFYRPAGIPKKAVYTKPAQLQKEIPPDETNGQSLSGLDSLIRTARIIEPALPMDILESMRGMGAMDAVGGLLGLGIVPMDSELSMLGLGGGDINDIQPAVNIKVASLVQDYIPYRTSYEPYLSARLSGAAKMYPAYIHTMEKAAAYNMGAVLIAGALYGKILSTLAQKIGPQHPLFKLLAKPGIQLGLLAAGTTAIGAVHSYTTKAPLPNTVDSGQVIVPDTFDITKLSEYYLSTVDGNGGGVGLIDIDEYNKVAALLNYDKKAYDRYVSYRYTGYIH